MQDIAELLREARAAGLTMIVLDGRRIGGWHKNQKRYLAAYGVDPLNPGPALVDLLRQAIDPTYDPEILI